MNQDPYRYFRIEAGELFDVLHAGALELERGGGDEVVKRMLRAAHTLKGAARAVRLPEVADHAHAIEDALDPFRTTGGAPRAAVEAILPRLDDLAQRIRALGGAAGTEPPPAGNGHARVAAPEPAADPPRALRAEIGDMDVVLDGVVEARTALGTLRRLAGDVDQVHRLAELVVGQLGAPSAESGVQIRATATELARALGAIDRGLGGAIEKLDRELHGVHDAAEQLRLVPASAMFTIAERAARDAARALGKSIAFECRGGEVRLDGYLLAAVQPALIQLVRNAVAHGIEPEVDRMWRGKPAAGRIAIDVERRPRRAVFRCRDDGGGLDVKVLREVAIRRGVVPPAGRAPSATELTELLLRGGLSTSATVNEIAGRGIGLDVVRDAVNRLGGSVAVSSEPGVGTAFELEVPVSLAAVDALAVEHAGTTAAIPLDAVRCAMRVGASDIVATPTGAAVAYGDQLIPFVALGAMLGREPTSPAAMWSVIVIEDRGRVTALGVSRLVGTATIVVRPLPELAPADPVIGGAAFDPDGAPQLVLDPAGLVMARPRSLVQAPAPPRHRILVIDDSVTTRMLEQRILESAGYDVDLAVSAEDGLARAHGEHYALFLVDVEMPGMDGFGFIEHVRRDPELSNTPAILVTSRASPADRARGREAGASGFVAKGEFDQGALLEQIARLVA